jgi:hypothetical protein
MDHINNTSLTTRKFPAATQNKIALVKECPREARTRRPRIRPEPHTQPPMTTFSPRPSSRQGKRVPNSVFLILPAEADKQEKSQKA